MPLKEDLKKRNKSAYLDDLIILFQKALQHIYRHLIGRSEGVRGGRETRIYKIKVPLELLDQSE